jgi:hypothetical protein
MTDRKHEQEQEPSSHSSFSFESVEKAEVAVRCDARKRKLLCYRPLSRAQSELSQYLLTHLLVRLLSIIAINRAYYHLNLTLQLLTLAFIAMQMLWTRVILSGA